MSDDFVASVKGITKDLETGIKLAKRISKSLSSSPGPQTLNITETTEALQKSLEGDSQGLRNVYWEAVRLCGESFTKAVVENHSYQTRLKELRIELIDRLNDCRDFEEDEPETFNKSHFTNLQQTALKCSAECISMFSAIRDPILQGQLEKAQMEKKPNDDRARLSIMKERQSNPIRIPSSPTTRRPLPPTFRPVLNKPELSIQPPPVEPAMPKNVWTIESPAGFSVGQPLKSILATSSPQTSHDFPPSSKPDISTFQPIPREVVKQRLLANEEFLERRQIEKLLFQREIRNSVASIKENRASEIFSNSLKLNSLMPGPSIAIDTTGALAEERRISGLRMGSVVTPPLDGPRSPVSPGDGSGSRASIQKPLQRSTSQASQDLIFGPPSLPHSPPQSTRGSGSENWGSLATTLKTPDFGRGVETGLEVNASIDYDDGKILVSEFASHRTPTSSMKSLDNPMRHDSSFYLNGGFCGGSKAVLRGETGFKRYKRPYGQYGETTSARCKSCSLEVGWPTFELDRTLDRSGIYGNSGIRWRQKFILKCHVRTKSVEDPIYACIFCIEDHKTVEEHDATIFFSVSSLFRHLAKHSQPLPNIPGIDVIYGVQPPTVVDFDLNFTTSIPRWPEFRMAEIAGKVATRPSGFAKSTHHPKNGSSTWRDPDGQPVLHFAAGARIVGITFPEPFRGQWCIGYHDGERGSFPSSTITIALPPREDVLMNPQSLLIAYARWDFNPQDVKEGHWLKFSKGDKLTAVGFTFQDQWCWSGQTSKGKWGLFPSAFVENVQEMKTGQQPVGRPESMISGRGFRIGSISLGRAKSSRKDKETTGRESNGSLLSQSTSPTTTLSGGMSSWPPPGLELASGRTGSWKS